MDAMSGRDDVLTTDQSSSAPWRANLDQGLPRVNSKSGFWSSNNSSSRNGRSSAVGLVDDVAIVDILRLLLLLDGVGDDDVVPRVDLSRLC